MHNNLVTCKHTVVKTALIPEYCHVYSTNIYWTTMNYVRRWINTAEQHSIIYSTHSIETRRHSNKGYSLNSSVDKQQQQQSEYYCLSKLWKNLHTNFLGERGKKKYIYIYIYKFSMSAYNITFHIMYVHRIQPPFHAHNNSSVHAHIMTWILIKEVVQLFGVYSCRCNYELQVSLFLKEININQTYILNKFKYFYTWYKNIHCYC